MSLFNRLFPSHSQKRLIRALGSVDEAFADQIAWDLLRRDLRAQIYRPAYRHVVLGPKDIDAANSVLYAAMRLSTAEASSGRHHIYRGTLGMIGVSYRVIALRALKALAGNGFMTSEDMDHEAAVLRENVRSEG